MNIKTYAIMFVIGTLSILGIFPFVVHPMLESMPEAGMLLANLLIVTLFLFWYFLFKNRNLDLRNE